MTATRRDRRLRRTRRHGALVVTAMVLVVVALGCVVAALLVRDPAEPRDSAAGRHR